MLGAQVLRVLQRRVVARLLRLQRASPHRRASAAGPAVRLNSWLARSKHCFACTRSAARLLHVRRLLDRRAGAADRARRTARARGPARRAAASRLYSAFSRSSSTSTSPACTRSPRSGWILLTMPSASDETVTSSTAASVPTISTERVTVCSPTGSTLTAFAASSRPRAWAVSPFAHPVAASASGSAKETDRHSTRVTSDQRRHKEWRPSKAETSKVYDGDPALPCL